MDQTPKIREICLQLLTRREHSRRELLDKLAVRGFDRIQVGTIVDALAEDGWQSDRRFTESYARQRMQKGYGPLRIVYELQQRGGDGETIDLDALAQEAVDGWDEAIFALYCRKFDDCTMLSARDWLKRSRFLQQRGFGSAQIRNLLERLQIKLFR